MQKNYPPPGEFGGIRLERVVGAIIELIEQVLKKPVNCRILVDDTTSSKRGGPGTLNLKRGGPDQPSILTFSY